MLSPVRAKHLFRSSLVNGKNHGSNASPLQFAGMTFSRNRLSPIRTNERVGETKWRSLFSKRFTACLF
jgi:hypothetical protein